MDKNCKNKRFTMPQKGIGEALIKQTIKEWHARDESLSFTGKVSGCRYTQDEKLDDLIRNEAKNFIYHNPLHTSQFPSTRQMESELIAITCQLFHNPGYGVITTGGTESIALAVLAHRNFYREKKGIKTPNIVIPNTAHVAFNKACHYFEIEVRSIPVNPQTLTLSASEISRHIDSNTIMLVGSFPNYAYGNVENIKDYAKIAQKKDIGLHVDCCLGGFLVAFQDSIPEMNLGQFDFRVDGVTSISCDHHQYGLAPKGVSICMFATNELRHCAYFGVSNWVGGLYITPTMSGSRTAAPIVGAWISIMYNGREKFIQNAKQIHRAIEELKQGIRTQFPNEFELMGSDVSVVCFRSQQRNLNIYELNDYLHKKKGWTLSAVQKPAAIHCSITLKIANNIPLLLKDLRECVDYTRSNPQSTKGSTVELYGASVLVPDNAALEEVMKGFVDVFIGMK